MKRCWRASAAVDNSRPASASNRAGREWVRIVSSLVAGSRNRCCRSLTIKDPSALWVKKAQVARSGTDRMARVVLRCRRFELGQPLRQGDLPQDRLLRSWARGKDQLVAAHP